MSALSVPGLSRIQMCARSASSVRRGSATMSLAPFSAARFILLPMIGCASVALDPMMKRTSSCSISPIELVIAPDPNVAARPATVGACQVRAQ